MNKLEKLVILEREQGSKVKDANKLGIKWYANRLKVQLKGCYRVKTNPKAFAIPILTASGLQLTI